MFELIEVDVEMLLLFCGYVLRPFEACCMLFKDDLSKLTLYFTLQITPIAERLSKRSVNTIFKVFWYDSTWEWNLGLVTVKRTF